MKYLVIGFCLTIYSVSSYSVTVREWWIQCKGSYAESTCLSDVELSKFKTICSDKKYSDDCRMVVDFSIAKTRISEAKKVLLSGYVSQLSNYSQNKRYLMDPDKIWDHDKLSGVFSFAIGVLPSCSSGVKRDLIFGENVRSEVRQFKKEITQLYNSLLSIPCSDVNKGFVLVAIGKVYDTKNDFEILTIDEKKNYKVIHSAVGAGPFTLGKNN